jgi:hypothetical protein
MPPHSAGVDPCFLVDARFRHLLKAIRQDRGLSLRELAGRVTTRTTTGGNIVGVSPVDVKSAARSLDPSAFSEEMPAVARVQVIQG